MKPRVGRWTMLVAITLSTGCSAILGFKDGTLLADGGDGAACGSGGGGAQCPPSQQCIDSVCRMPATCTNDAGCTPVLEAGSNGATVLTTFSGDAGGGMIAAEGYVYFTYDENVAGCDGNRGCDGPKSMYMGGPNPDHAKPRFLAAEYPHVAWTSSGPESLRHCDFSRLRPCDTAFTEMERAVATTYDLMGNLYWLNADAGDAGTESELRVLPPGMSGMRSTVAFFPATNTSAAIAAQGPTVTYALIGAELYSVVSPSGDAGAGKVTLLRTEPAPASVPRLVIAGGRLIWPRSTTGAGGGLAQCSTAGGPSAPCNAAPLASEGDEITALTSYDDTVVWGRSSKGGNDIFYCKLLAGSSTTDPCTRGTLVGGLPGRVTAIAIEPPLTGPSSPTLNVYFMVTDPNGKLVVERAALAK